MRKLFHTVAALSALVATSMTANAADVTARPAPYAPPAPGHLKNSSRQVATNLTR